MTRNVKSSTFVGSVKQVNVPVFLVSLCFFIMAGYMPQKYLDTLVDFINANDPKWRRLIVVHRLFDGLFEQGDHLAEFVEGRDEGRP